MGQVSLWNPPALHFAGAGSLDRLQTVGVGRLHIWLRAWSDAWSLDRDKLTQKQLKPHKLSTKAWRKNHPFVAEQQGSSLVN